MCLLTMHKAIDPVAFHLLSVCLSVDLIKEQTKELRGTQRQITRDRTALEKQEKQMVTHAQMQTLLPLRINGTSQGILHVFLHIASICMLYKTRVKHCPNSLSIPDIICSAMQHDSLKAFECVTI